jgi:hypothetical protein
LNSRRRENEGKAKYARGLADGSAARERGLSITSYVAVGIDEYCKGFRAGYYDMDRRAGQIRIRAAS